jgi:MoxR-like ATPase
MNESEVNIIMESGQQIRRKIEKIIVGKGAVIELVLVARLWEGHVLMEDVPGIGKTMLARSVSRSLKCQF